MSDNQMPTSIESNTGADSRILDRHQRSVEELKEELFSCLPADGASKSNAELQRILGVTSDEYWTARNRLLEEGRVVRGRGRGGSTARVLEEPLEEEPLYGDDSVYTQRNQRRKEEDLYAPLEKVLIGGWQADKGHDYLAVEDVSRSGRRNTGGRWTRPDLVAVEVGTYRYLPQKTLSVYTFEVKPEDAIDVTAVYEALAHRRAATHSYVLLHVPNEAASSAALDAVIMEARRHGIGVIVFSDPSDYGTWDEKVVADRVEPEPVAIDDFIRTQLSDSAREKIEKAVR